MFENTFNAAVVAVLTKSVFSWKYALKSLQMINYSIKSDFRTCIDAYINGKKI